MPVEGPFMLKVCTDQPFLRDRWKELSEIIEVILSRIAEGDIRAQVGQGDAHVAITATKLQDVFAPKPVSSKMFHNHPEAGPSPRDIVAHEMAQLIGRSTLSEIHAHVQTIPIPGVESFSISSWWASPSALIIF